MYIYEQYNPEMTRRNTPKLKYFIPIEKIKHALKWNCPINFRYIVNLHHR
jgi:hypothetical protein